MSQPLIVGLKPRLPGSLGTSSWWTKPVRAERLAALRMGVGATLLLDILFCYLPYVDVFFNDQALGGARGAADPRPLPLWSWSPLEQVTSVAAWQVILNLWALAALAIAVGIAPRVCAAAALLLSGAVYNANPLLMNAGDNVRQILLFYLVLTPCGAVWSLDRRRTRTPVYIWPWALRLLLVQMAATYFVTGVSKLSPLWLKGEAIYYVANSLDWTRWSYALLPIPYGLCVAGNWLTLFWEISFPLLVLFSRTRNPALWLGVLFHLVTGVALKLGMFPVYMLCLYLPLAPWEVLFRRSMTRVVKAPKFHADARGVASGSPV